MRRDRDRILERTDLVALADQLLGPRTRGTSLWRCPNPSHEQTGRTPPLSVFVDRRGHQRWHCHGCGDGGTAIDLLLRTGTARDVADALARLDDQPTPLPPPRSPRPGRPPESRPTTLLRDATAAALGRYMQGCVSHLHSAAGRRVQMWLIDQRAIPAAVLDQVGVGADPGAHQLERPRGVPRVFPAAVFPVCDRSGRVIFTLSRHLRPTCSRWWNVAAALAPNPGVAFYDPLRSRLSCTIITEGPLDALSALTAGYPAAALLGGAGLSDQVADRLAVHGGRMILALDNDDFGRRGTERLGDLLDERHVPWATLDIPHHHNDLNAWHTASRACWSNVVRERLALIPGTRDCPGPDITIA